MRNGTNHSRKLVFVGLICATLFLCTTDSSLAQSPSKIAAQIQPSTAKILDSMVRINMRNKSLAKAGESLGLIVKENGLIITSASALADAYIVTATVADGTTYFVESILASDDNIDLALLRIRGKKLPTASLAAGIIPTAGSTLFAFKSWAEKNTPLHSGESSPPWKTSDNLDMYEFNVQMDNQGWGGPVIDKTGALVGISNSVQKVFRRNISSNNSICPTSVIATFLEKNTQTSGRRLVSASNGAFGPDGANKLEKIWAYLDDNKYETAQRELRVMPSLLQEAYLYTITLGITQYKLERFETAAKTLAKASLATTTDDNPSYYGGMALRHAKKFEQSIFAFQTTTQRNPQHIKAFIAMGRSYNAMQQPSLAVSVLTKALEIDPNSAQAHLNIGVSYWGLSNREKTEHHLLQASMIDPRGPAGMRATALLDSGIPMPDEQ